MRVLGNSLPTIAVSACLQLIQRGAFRASWAHFVCQQLLQVFISLPSFLSSHLHSASSSTVDHSSVCRIHSVFFPRFLYIHLLIWKFHERFFSSIFLSNINPVRGDFLEHSRNLVIYGKQMWMVCVLNGVEGNFKENNPENKDFVTVLTLYYSYNN